MLRFKLPLRLLPLLLSFVVACAQPGDNGPPEPDANTAAVTDVGQRSAPDSAGTPDRDTSVGPPAEPCAGFETTDARFSAALAVHYLDVHNAKRAQYCLAPLVWDANLAKVAQAYADKGAGDLPHNPDRNAEYAALIGCSADCPALGENISWQQPWDYWPIEDMAQGWLDEEEDEPGCNYGGSHYTQIVQEHTTAVGCGLWVDDNDRLHFVCNYLGWQYGGAAFPDENCSCGGAIAPSAVACP